MKLKWIRTEFLVAVLFAVLAASMLLIYSFKWLGPHQIPNSLFGDKLSTDEKMAALDIVDLNSASTKELTLLPGVGPVIAERIVRYREEHGPFTAAEEILSVSGIGEYTYFRFRDFVTVR